MKLVLFQTPPAGEILPGVLTDRGVVDISAAVRKSYTPQLTMQGIIDEFEPCALPSKSWRATERRPA